MVCPACGTESDETSQFCAKCGASLAAISQPRTALTGSAAAAVNETPAPWESANYRYPQSVGVASQPGTFVDPRSGLVLPEGVQLATAGRRIGAFFLAIPLSIVTLGIGYFIWGVVIWGRGQTPALQVLGMRCWRPETGRVAGWGWMALREVVGRIAESILSIITLLLSFILMMSGKERKSLHDHIAGTVVVYDPEKRLR
jgi:uncharacterized RDD family membrane protein YckC